MNRNEFNEILNRMTRGQIIHNPGDKPGGGPGGPTSDLQSICENCKNSVSQCLAPLGYNEAPCDAIKRAIKEMSIIRQAINKKCRECNKIGVLDGQPGPCYGQPFGPGGESTKCPISNDQWCEWAKTVHDGPQSEPPHECQTCLTSGLGLGDSGEVYSLFCGLNDCFKNHAECIDLMKQNDCCPFEMPDVPFNPFWPFIQEN